jgi:hypothetical protein
VRGLCGGDEVTARVSETGLRLASDTIFDARVRHGMLELRGAGICRHDTLEFVCEQDRRLP